MTLMSLEVILEQGSKQFGHCLMSNQCNESKFLVNASLGVVLR